MHIRNWLAGALILGGLVGGSRSVPGDEPAAKETSQPAAKENGKAAGGPQAERLPLVFQDDFEQTDARWEPSDPQAWKRTKTPAGYVYDQHKKRSQYEPPHRSPYNFALVKDVVVSDFVLKTRVRSTHPDYGHRDACLFFGYQDPGHFYYVHLGKKTDDHANQIFIVNGKPRTKISRKTTPGTDWDDQWHDVKIVRKVADGTIEIFFDDMQNPVMVAKDTTFTWGRVGVGSFDDTSQWDDFQLWATETQPPASP